MLFMNDEDNKPAQQPAKTSALPPQSSPTDTSNWDDRAFVAPDGKVHIENGYRHHNEARPSAACY